VKQRLLSSIRESAQGLTQWMTSIRRSIHAHPELAFREHQTAALVSAELDQLGIPHTVGIGGTGIVSRIKGASPGRIVGLRADMDALPIMEANTCSYRSITDGVMHACGHDAHVAMLLGAARILSQHQEEIRGEIVLIFQPAEETGEGARAMAKAAAIPSLDGLLALHVGLGGYRVGEIGIARGPALAGADFFEARFVGRGGHGAQPHLAVNPIQPCARWVLASSELVPAETSPLDPCVLTVTSIHSGVNENVIPSEAFAQGSIRSFDQKSLIRLRRRLSESVNHLGASSQLTGSFTIKRSFPVTHNSHELVESAFPILRALLGTEVIHSSPPVMGSEDISWLAEAPLLYLFLGSRSAEKAPPNHHPAFDIDETCLPIGAATEAALAVGLLVGMGSSPRSKSP